MLPGVEPVHVHLQSMGRFGLSNRIRSMAGHYALAKSLGGLLRVDWHASVSCPGHFLEVLCAMPGIEFSSGLPGQPPESYISVGVGGLTTCGSTPEHIYGAYCQKVGAKEYFMRYVDEFYTELKPVESIHKEVQRFWTAHELDTVPTLGVHVRRTDLIADLMNKGIELPSDDAIDYEIESFLSEYGDGMIFVASDSFDAVNRLKGKFGGRILVRTVDWIDSEGRESDPRVQARTTTLSSAVADIYSLSCCGRIVGTRGSSFSTFAAKWGKRSLVLV